MAKQSFIVLIEKDEDGVFIGTVPSLKGCYSPNSKPYITTGLYNHKRGDITCRWT